MIVISGLIVIATVKRIIEMCVQIILNYQPGTLNASQWKNRLR